MKKALIDTDILSLFFRGDENVKSCFQSYLQEHNKMNLSIISYYEIVSGLRYRDSKKQLSSFFKFVQYNSILPMTEVSAKISAETYANLRKEGQPIDDIDLLIAGIAISNNLVLVTHNTNHFKRIEGLEIEDWCYA